MVDYSSMSIAELREVAKVQAHELQKYRTTKFKDEFARRIGLQMLKELRVTPVSAWSIETCKIYREVADANPVGARCWREGEA